jgi:hypothetical protein
MGPAKGGGKDMDGLGSDNNMSREAGVRTAEQCTGSYDVDHNMDPPDKIPNPLIDSRHLVYHERHPRRKEILK